MRTNPNSDLTAEEIIRLIRAASREAGADAMSEATTVSPLEADEKDATIYLAPGAQLSDDVLKALIAAAEGLAIDAQALSNAVDDGSVTLLTGDRAAL